MIKNFEKISSIKRKKIEDGVAFIHRMNQIDPVIKQVILFGSAIRDDCTEESDIDICLVTDSNCSNPVFFQIYGGLEIVMNDLCDIFVYQKLQSPLKDEIDKKGIIIYELQDN